MPASSKPPGPPYCEVTVTSLIPIASPSTARVSRAAHCEASRIAAVGAANAGAIDAQVRAYGGPEYRLTEQIATRLFEAVAQGHQPVMPQIMVSGEGGSAKTASSPG